MTDATAEAAEFEHRLPAAYSQGFAHVRIVSIINPDDPGPLGGSDLFRQVEPLSKPLNAAPKLAPLLD